MDPPWDVDWESADVTIKAESHLDIRDHREELQAVRSGEYDAIVKEGARQSAEEFADPAITDRIMDIPFFFLETLYRSPHPIHYSALKQGLNLRWTRESNGDVIGDLPAPVVGLIFGLVIILAGAVLIFGGAGGTYWLWSMAAYCGLFILPLGIRMLRGRFGTSLNRNQIMADRIAETAQSADRTLAIVGARHASKVKSRLPEELDVVTAPTAGGLLSPGLLKQLAPRLLLVLLQAVGIWIALTGVGRLLLLLLAEGL